TLNAILRNLNQGAGLDALFEKLNEDPRPLVTAAITAMLASPPSQQLVAAEVFSRAHSGGWGKMLALSEEQARQLSSALVTAFDSITLPWVVRSSIGPNLSEIVSVQQPFDLLINDLISWIERRGIGTLEAFLHSAILARPESLALRQFCKEHFPKSLDEIQAAE